MFEPNTPGIQFTESYTWLPDFGIRYIVGVDGLNVLLVLLVNFLMFTIIMSQWHIDNEKQRWFFLLLLVLESMMTGALVALDMLFFYAFWEALLLPVFFMIGIWGGRQRIYAATKYFLYTAVGSLAMLAAAITLYNAHFIEFKFVSTSVLDLYKVNLAPQTQLWLFAAFAMAFAIKIPLWPFHTWLVHVHREGPSTASVILASLMINVGVYGFLRFAIPLFPDAAVYFAPMITGISIVGILYGALVAWTQEDAKKLLAFGCLSHVGLICIGLLAFTATEDKTSLLSPEALTGTIFQTISHSISMATLFLLVGVLSERQKSTNLRDFGGLAGTMPFFAVMLLVATFSFIGLPGTGGFIGIFLILIGVFQSSAFAGTMATIGILLGAVYALALLRRTLFGPSDHQPSGKGLDLSAREIVFLTPLAILIILMGVFPNLFLDSIAPSVTHLSKNFKSYSLSLDSADPASSRITEVTPHIPLRGAD